MVGRLVKFLIYRNLSGQTRFGIFCKFGQNSQILQNVYLTLKIYFIKFYKPPYHLSALKVSKLMQNTEGNQISFSRQKFEFDFFTPKFTLHSKSDQLYILHCRFTKVAGNKKLLSKILYIYAYNYEPKGFFDISSLVLVVQPCYSQLSF